MTLNEILGFLMALVVTWMILVLAVSTMFAG